MHKESERKKTRNDSLKIVSMMNVQGWCYTGFVICCCWLMMWWFMGVWSAAANIENYYIELRFFFFDIQSKCELWVSLNCHLRRWSSSTLLKKRKKVCNDHKKSKEKSRKNISSIWHARRCFKIQGCNLS
jgi:hypothetical protein